MGALSTGSFWLAALERAIKTFAQAVIAIITVATTTAVDIDWLEAVYAGGIAALVSILTSIVSAGIGNHDGPSLATEELAPPVPPVIAESPVVAP